MRWRKLLFGCLMSVFLQVVVATGQGLDGFAEPQYLGQGHNLRWSPDGTKVAYFTGGQLVYADSSDITDITSIGDFNFLKYCWASDSSLLGLIRYYNKPKEEWFKVSRIVEVDLHGMLTEIAYDSTYRGKPDKVRIGWPMRFRDGTAGYIREGSQLGVGRRLIRTSETAPMQKLSPWQAGRLTILNRKTGLPLSGSRGDICLVSTDGEVIRQLTFDENFFSPKMSPRGDLILAARAGEFLTILDTSGAVVWDPVARPIHLLNGNVAYPVNESWAPDGDRIAYSLTEEDGHKIFGSDIYIATISNRTVFKITDNPTIEKSELSWHPNGQRLIYRTEDGGLYMLEVR